MCKKNCILISICFCVICSSNDREILKKYTKGAITLAKKQFFKNLRKPFLDIHIRNVMPKFQCSRLNRVAVIAKTYIHTHTYCRALVIPKKFCFAVIDKELKFLSRFDD